MTQVNLLPVEVKQRQRTRRMTGLIVAGGVAVVGLLFFVFVLQSARLSKAEDELAAQEQRNATIQAQISELQRFADLKAVLLAKQALVTEATDGRVMWSGVLRDVSMVIPGDMWLSSLSATMAAPATDAGAATVVPVEGEGAAIVGSMQFEGTAFNQRVISKWLTRLESVEGWVNPWISATNLEESTVPVYQFAGTVDLTTEATEVGRPQ